VIVTSDPVDLKIVVGRMNGVPTGQPDGGLAPMAAVIVAQKRRIGHLSAGIGKIDQLLHAIATIVPIGDGTNPRIEMSAEMIATKGHPDAMTAKIGASMDRPFVIVPPDPSNRNPDFSPLGTCQRDPEGVENPRRSKTRWRRFSVGRRHHHPWKMRILAPSSTITGRGSRWRLS
jgi:hypothetical protein